MSRPALHALVLGDGDASERAALDAAWPGWDRDIGLVVAADGGARLATRLGLAIDQWVGDGDSLSAEEIDGLAASGVAVRLVPTAKDESDLELAVVAAVDAGATRLSILGALGGRRADHTLANVALLGHERLVGHTAQILDATARVSLLVSDGAAAEPAGLTLEGHPDDVVSLLPVGGTVEGVTTESLAYPLRDEPLLVGSARGLSNIRIASPARVTIRAGRLLVIETPANLAR
jgi:thiamine pyrophosphokinase